MRNYGIDEFAAKAAKEIVVAKISTSNISISAEDGKKVAEFYTEIFNGIADTLGESQLDGTKAFRKA